MTEAKCPFPHEAIKASVADSGTTDKKWWPENNISLEPLLHQNPKSDPMGEGFDYVKEFNTLNLDEVKRLIRDVMLTPVDWWPADWGHYGPFFIRMAWHSAGTYRATDGRGGGGQGLQRFAPLNSWPDNVNLDKARRLLWPVKKYFGRKLSWADLMILAGNVALEDMGLPTFGFAGGRSDVWEPDNTYWGSEGSWLANERYDSNDERSTLENPLAAVQMGLIYVNPEGPDGDSDDFVGSAADIRTTFARMAMNDEETVALIAGGHAFGKTHGAGDASQVGPAPEGADLSSQNLGWKNSQGKGHSEDTISSGLEGAWTPTPLKWDNKYLELIYKYEWHKVSSPAGAQQWEPVDCDPEDMVPDAHVEGKMNKPVMLTTDLALRFGDSEYERISREFLEDFDKLTDAFARAWFKLTHRDMGPSTRYHGVDSPDEVLLWQDPVFLEDYSSLSEKQSYNLKANIKSALDSGDLVIADLVYVAYVSASTYRDTDKRGGANGARVLLEPMRSWQFTDIDRVEPVVDKLKEIRNSLNINMSVADLIVFAGNVGVEQAARNVDAEVSIPFIGGRGDATQEWTDEESFAYLEPIHDGFLNWVKEDSELREPKSLAANLEKLLVDKAALLTLTPVEMTVLLAGLRAMGVTHREAVTGERVGMIARSEDKSPYRLDTAFFQWLLNPDIYWTGMSSTSLFLAGSEVLKEEVAAAAKWLFVGTSSSNPNHKMVASRADMVFSANSVLRAISEVYGSDDAREKFIHDFVAVWQKLMMLDRFDVDNSLVGPASISAANASGGYAHASKIIN